jgi:hypothetical protein
MADESAAISSRFSAARHSLARRYSHKPANHFDVTSAMASSLAFAQASSRSPPGAPATPIPTDNLFSGFDRQSAPHEQHVGKPFQPALGTIAKSLFNLGGRSFEGRRRVGFLSTAVERMRADAVSPELYLDEAIDTNDGDTDTIVLTTARLLQQRFPTDSAIFALGIATSSAQQGLPPAKQLTVDAGLTAARAAMSLHGIYHEP